MIAALIVAQSALHDPIAPHGRLAAGEVFRHDSAGLLLMSSADRWSRRSGV
jgi:hypothetical protein